MPITRMRARSLTALLAVLAALSAVAVALVGSGCGSSGSSLDPVAQAAETTTHAAGYHMEFTGQVTAGLLPGAIALSGTGFFNPGGREGSMTLTITGIPGVTSGGGLSMHELFKSTTVYVGSSLFAGKLPGGARWMKLDLARVGQAAGINFQSLTSGGTNPAQFVEFLKASAGSVTRVGQETVRGVQTTRYRANVDIGKIADAVPSSERAAMRKAVTKLAGETGLRTLPMEVWVDAHKMARRIALSMSLTTQGQSIQAAFKLDLFDFGATPAVEVPAASETYEPSTATLGKIPAG